MKCFIPLVAILSVAMAGVSEVSVRLPFLNPAGVTYVGGPAPVGLAAGPYSAQQLTIGGSPAFASAYAQPTAFAQPLAPVAQPVHVPAVTASVHHVPGVADVPVTHIEATPGVVQKLVDVAHPAVSTRKFHVRRPAIQKQFYDIEERVVVRPAGSALVELDEPLSKEQRGPALISRALHPLPAIKAIPAIHSISAIHAAPTIPSYPVSSPSAPSGPSADFPASSPAPSQQPSQDSFNDQDSVSVENPEFRGTQNQQEEQDQQQQQQQQQQAQQQQDQQQPSPDQLIANFQSQIRSRQQSFTPQFRQFLSEREQYEARQFQFPSLAQQQQQQQQFQPEQQGEQRDQPAPQTRQFQQEQQQSSQGQTEARFGNIQQEEQRSSEVEGRSVFPSLRNLDAASSQANQQRLIDLLTARGGVAEVGFGRSGPASGANVEAGGVRARVISATPAPAYADPAGERVSTRRVVVSRPVETLQELDVVEPVTKLERVAVNTPTLFKTARLGVARVPTSYPVIQKTYAPAAVPVYGKALAHPALTYY